MISAHPPKAPKLRVDQREFLAAQVGNPEFEPVYHAVFMCNSRFETEAYSEPWPEKDPERAKELFAEAVCGRPVGCKWFRRFARACGQVRSCVRPRRAAVHTPRARMESGGSRPFR
jgi:hypothetical protein